MKGKFKILLCSSFGKFDLGSSYFRALIKMNYNVLCFDMEKTFREYYFRLKTKYERVITLPILIYMLNKELINIVKDFNPDLMFIHKGQWIFPKTLIKIKEFSKATLFNFNPDNPFSKDFGSSSYFVIKSIPIYDCYFIWSKVLMKRLESRKAKRIHYLPFGWDPYIHYPCKPTPEELKVYSSDITFIGNWEKERECWLSNLQDYNLSIWGGNYWITRNKNDFLKSCWKGRDIYGEEMSKVCNSSKINLNILRLQNKGAHNMRTFEVLGCGGFLLHERTSEILEIFEEGRDFECFQNIEELKSKIDFYIKNDEKRKKIARNGFKAVQKHTYENRVKEIIKIYEEML